MPSAEPRRPATYGLLRLPLCPRRSHAGVESYVESFEYHAVIFDKFDKRFTGTLVTWFTTGLTVVIVR